MAANMSGASKQDGNLGESDVEKREDIIGRLLAFQCRTRTCGLAIGRKYCTLYSVHVVR